MTRFVAAHATHPDARMALALAAAQIDGQRAALAPALQPTLGWIYLGERYADDAEALLDELRQRWPGCHWCGAVGVGVAACGVEYFDEPALVLMLSDLPPAQFQVFNGRRPLDARRAHTALVHADPATPELDELLAELSQRTASGYLFGGLASSHGRCLHIADGVFEGGLSGVAFAPEVALVSRVSQGCQPLGPVRRITAVGEADNGGAGSNLVLALDDAPALPQLLDDLGVTLDRPQVALNALRRTLIGLSEGGEAMLARGGQFGHDTRVRHLIGIDPGHDAVAVAGSVATGQQLAFCRRDAEAARRDLVRICAEIRDEVDSRAAAPAVAAGEPPPAPRIAAAVYVSCSGRGGPHFGGPSAELQILRHALGELPLVGFFAAGEIGHHHLYGYTGVLTVFLAP